MDAESQRLLIVEQFTKQAIPFSEMPAHSDHDTNRLVIETAGLGASDRVLDVACGPGLITCAAAEVVESVTGIDITPAMIEQAKRRQQAKGLTNMTWQVGDVEPLPFASDSFTAVITRYSFHHFLEPKAALKEMARVCVPHGKVCVIDVITSSPEQALAYDRLEKLRDPSHVHGLSLEELTGMFHDAGLTMLRTAFYKVEMELEKSLAASFPNPGDAEEIRRLFNNDIRVNQLGLGASLKDGAVWFAYPIAIIVGIKH